MSNDTHHQVARSHGEVEGQHERSRLLARNMALAIRIAWGGREQVGSGFLTPL